MARRLDSEIKILPNGDWCFRGSNIEQKDILEYFRKSLREASDGVYISNEFGELSEKGYLELNGYASFLTSFEEVDGDLVFTSDAGIKFKRSDLEIAADREGVLYAKEIGSKFLKYRLARNVISALSDYIEETKDGLILKTEKAKVKILETSEGPEVPLPVEFRTDKTT
ncbi:hypothetical protein CH373_14825 [Leptospira perolatii]|uniref:DUF1285 domain-containing protein n=1 Tax=Leptospira perolatii TaxID=2023191 RepID=A0A2M9ZK50_9LEPT|nr:hypothetical protein [Leptospira perolatii]PJZ69200.1 hypothetical protein CH360_11795 [Leptospira perolatii]PJZ72418.1 hypothetical protein CH373_14825 [Leptospira perolatii]